MKIVELLNHVQIHITNEEADVLGRFAESTVIGRADFNNRELHVANQLVNKDVLLRKNQNGQITYKKKQNI